MGATVIRPVLAARGQIGGVLAAGGGRGGYAAKVLGYSPWAYWPLNEISGTTADNAEGTAARDGTYNGVALNNSTFSNGDPVGLWDGTADYCDINTASLLSAWNRAEGTFAGWAKVASAGVWNDAALRCIFGWYRDAANAIVVRKTAVANQLLWYYEGGNVIKQVSSAVGGTTDWFHVAITWSDANDRVRAYFNGTQVGIDQTGVTAYLGDPDAASGLIGAVLDTPAQPWSGWLAHCGLFPLLTDSAILDLATV